MTNEELQSALLSKEPVIFNDVVNGDVCCERVGAVVYTNDRGRIKCSAVLLDKNGRGHYKCSPERVRAVT